MRVILIVEAVGFFAVLLLEVIWGVRGALTERRFVLPPVASLTLIIMTAGLDAYLSSPYPFGLVVGTLGIVISAVIEYLLFRYVYRQSFPQK
jgi:hypothetical protein